MNSNLEIQKEVPLVSVIFPVYNVEQFLRQCLDSIKNQTLYNIEIICVDDGSTDSSFEILKEYAKQDSRFIILHQENSGAGAARNKGLDIAQGEYLLFLDSDDFFELNMLEISYNKARKTGADIVVFQSDRYIQAEDRFVDISSIDYKLLPQSECFAATDVKKNIFRSVVGWTWDKLFRHTFINSHKIRFQEIRIHNDLLFTYAALISAEKIVLLNNKFTHQRKRGGGSISDEFKEWWCTFDALKGLNKFIENNYLNKRYGQDYVNYAAYLLLYNLNRLQGNVNQQYKTLMRQKWLYALGIANVAESEFYDKSMWRQCRNILYSFTPNCIKGFGVSQNPKISVIVPSLNSAQYIDECIQSITNQTLTDIEILCVDAGSTDGTIERLKVYANIDKRIRIINSSKKSYGYQVNLGLDNAKGEFFGIVESDDYILSDMYQELYDLTQKYQLDSVKCDFCIFEGENDKRIFTNRYLSNEKKNYGKVLNPSNNIDLFKANNVNPPGIYSLEFIKKNYIRLNETSGASFQDNGLWFQIFAQSKRMYFCSRPFYMIRRDNPNSSVKSVQKIYCSCREYDFIREILKKSKVLEDKYASVCALYRHNNYNFTLKRIAPEYKLGFLHKYSEDFKEIAFNGELKRELFTQNQWETLQNIMDNPTLYYYTRITPQGELEATPSSTPALIQEKELYQIKELKAKLDAAGKEMCAIRQSWTYRIGRFFTWFPRKARGGIRCYKEHGFSYTFQRVLIHLNIKKEQTEFTVKKNIHTNGSFHLPQQEERIKESIKKDYKYFSQLIPAQYPEELRLWYERVTKEQLNLEDPKTFNEKIQWLKLYDSTPLKTCLADKYLVRDWVKERIGEEFLIPLLGVWEQFDDIVFDTLPKEFVLKANHGSGWNITVKDKLNFDKQAAKKSFDTWLNKNYAFTYGFELHYMNIPPKIVAEQYIAGLDGDIYDYRFFCFNGEPKYMWLDIGSGTSHHKRNIYDVNWCLLDYCVNYPRILPVPNKPDTFDEMLKYATILCKDFAFVRVDFYSVNNHVYFGEMTFTPQSGTGKWEDPEQNRIYGDLIQLPPKSPIPERKF